METWFRLLFKKRLELELKINAMIFSGLGSVEDWVKVAWEDAGVKSIPKVVLIYSNNLEQANLATILVTDSWSVPDITVIVQWMADEMIIQTQDYT